MTVLPSPEAMIVICTVVLIAYMAHVLDKAFASSEQFEAMLKARERIMGLEAENAKLRELCGDMMRYYFMPSAIDSKQREMELIERANKLGVEEDDGELGAEVES